MAQPRYRDPIPAPTSHASGPRISDEELKRIAARARFDPVWFARNVLNLRRKPGEPSIDDDPDNSWELDEWQIELLEVMADAVRKVYGKPTKINHEGKNLITIRACQGPGKTFGFAILLHWFGFCFYRSVMPCSAPKESQITNRLFREFARIRSRAIPGYSALTKVVGAHINWCDDRAWFAKAETGQQPENLQGFHARFIMVLLDEASGVPERIFPVLRGAISTGKVAICAMIGNPTRTMGGFADSHRQRSTEHDFYRMHIPYTKSKRVSRKWVEQMIRTYGMDSPAVKVRVFGDFADMEEGQLIALPWIADALRRSTESDGSLPRRRISVDVADGGVDDTVITIGTHYQTKTVVDFQRQYNFPSSVSPIMAADEAERLWKVEGMSEANGDDFVVDSLGVGAGTAGALMQRNYPVIPYKGGSSSANRDRFRNIRVQGYIALRDAFRDGTVAMNPEMCSQADMSELETQLCSIKLKNAGDRVEDLMTKQDMLRLGFTSPDRADSLAMQFATRSPRLVGATSNRGATTVIESTLLDGLVP